MTKRLWTIAAALTCCLATSAGAADPPDAKADAIRKENAIKIDQATAVAHAHADAHGDVPLEGVAVLQPKEGGEKVKGTIRLTQKGKDVELSGEVTGLSPGLHGFHIHEFGDLSDPKGMSAGGHYNPGGHKHGGPDSAVRHAGDLGNLKADAAGKATVKVTAKGVDLHFVLGRSLVVHAKEDDLKTDPSGEAGGRIAIGVIAIAQTKKNEPAKATGAIKSSTGTGSVEIKIGVEPAVKPAK